MKFDHLSHFGLSFSNWILQQGWRQRVSKGRPNRSSYLTLSGCHDLWAVTPKSTTADRIRENDVLSAGTLTWLCVFRAVKTRCGCWCSAGNWSWTWGRTGWEIKPSCICLGAFIRGSCSWKGHLFHAHFNLTSSTCPEGTVCSYSLTITSLNLYPVQKNLVQNALYSIIVCTDPTWWNKDWTFFIQVSFVCIGHYKIKYLTGLHTTVKTLSSTTKEPLQTSSTNNMRLPQTTCSNEI